MIAGTVELVIVLVDQVRNTRSPILTRRPIATHQFHGAVLAAPRGIAVTVIIITAVNAGAMQTRFVKLTLVDIRLAVGARESCLAFTKVRAHLVHTRSELAAGIRVAFVDVDFALLPRYSVHAETHVATGVVIGEGAREELGQAVFVVLRQLVQSHIRLLQTRSIVMARILQAVIKVHFAVLPGVPGIALAFVVVHFIQALRAILTRLRQTLVDIHLADLARESSSRAIALKLIQLVDAPATVVARLRCAIVNVRFAEHSSDAGHANATEHRNLVDTSGAEGARITGALVDVDATVLASEPGRTRALVVVDQIHADRVVLARHAETLVHLLLTEGARVTGSAIALERVHLVPTDPIVARLLVAHTLVNVVLAVGAIVAGHTSAGVLGRSLRIASSSVLARLPSAHRLLHDIHAALLATHAFEA